MDHHSTKQKKKKKKGEEEKEIRKMTTKPPPMIAPLPMTPIGQFIGDTNAAAASSTSSATTTAQTSAATTTMTPMPTIDPLAAMPPPAVDHLAPPTKRSNPGPLDRCDQEIQRVLRVDTFDGGRFELHKMLGPSFATAHTLYMGSSAHEKGSCKLF